jgi:hypothetical protein
MRVSVSAFDPQCDVHPVLRSIERLVAPWWLNLDFSVFKNFRLGERRSLQFRSEFFNIVNHPNFQGNDIQHDFDQAGPGTLTAANTSRQIQFALKLTY